MNEQKHCGGIACAIHPSSFFLTGDMETGDVAVKEGVG